MLKDPFMKDCIIAALSASSQNKISSYAYLYIPYFAFDYTKGTGDIGERIKNRWNLEKKWLLNSGKLITICDLDKTNLSLIKGMLKKNCSLIVWGNVYSCPWTPFYQKKYIKHVYLITDFCDNYFICDDEFFGVSNYKFDINESCKNMDSLHYTKITEINLSLNYVKKIMKYYLDKFKDLNDYMLTYKFFLEDLIEINISEQHMVNNNYYGNTLLRKLKNLSRYRYGYAEFLRQLSIDYNLELNNLVDNFEQLGELWIKLMLFLLRTFIRGRSLDDCEKILLTSLVKTISESEKAALQKLIIFVQN